MVVSDLLFRSIRLKVDMADQITDGFTIDRILICYETQSAELKIIVCITLIPGSTKLQKVLKCLIISCVPL